MRAESAELIFRSHETVGKEVDQDLEVDTEMRTTVFRDFAPDLTSEPMFVPRPDSVQEDAGWLLVTVYRSDEHRSGLLVLDANDLSTVCRARLPHHESPGFHGTWVPADV